MEALGIEISWPLRKPREKPYRVHNHHVSLRDRIQELKHHHHHPPKAGGAGGDKETTAKAVAWAVFQHHGEGGGLHHGHAHGIAVRRPTRFKIEAQMRHELPHRSVYEAAAAKWDAGSTLFDSFELHSLLKTLDDAAHAPAAPQKSHGDGEDAGAMVVYTPPKSPSRWNSDEKNPRAHGEARQRYSLIENVKHGREHHQEDASPVFDHWQSRRSFDSASEKPTAKAGDSHDHHHHHSKWKNLLHTLHLDGAHGLFHKSHKQVAPHDLEQRSRLRHNHGHSQGGQYFERNDLHVSMDVNPPDDKEEDPHRHHHHHHHPHFWKFGFKPFCRAGHATLSDSEGSDCEDPHPKKKYQGHRQTDLRKAWSSLTANLLHHHHHHHHDSPLVIEHQHHHHHHHHHEEVQARSRRASRDEKVRRVSSEDGGLRTPRNSLETVVVSVCT